jgi:mannose-1-phosphate guanylyltransferase/mannose-1-phosphate guanylyltransferase/phosphomannomutase
MKAFVLAAGKGTRLRPLTELMPKPLLPVLNRPVMGRVMDLCRAHGFTDLVANLHYKGTQIERAFADGSAYGVRLRYSREVELLGTAGGVRKQADFLNDGTFAVLSGDVVTDIDLTALVAFHRKRGALATLAVTAVSDPCRFGVVVADPDGRVRSFQEKPAPGTEKSNLVNMGIYILEPAVFDHIPASEPFDFGHQLFPRLLELGLPLYAHRVDAYWSDVGTLSQYLYTHWDLLSRPSARPRIGAGTVIEPGATISPTAMIGENCYVHGRAVILGNSCIGDGTVLGATAQVRDSVVWSAGTVLDRIERSIRTCDHCLAIG